ncbi:MAG: hypothetical protein WC471_03205 [Candidatus Woesearchaeota archaeon]
MLMKVKVRNLLNMLILRPEYREQKVLLTLRQILEILEKANNHSLKRPDLGDQLFLYCKINNLEKAIFLGYESGMLDKTLDDKGELIISLKQIEKA